MAKLWTTGPALMFWGTPLGPAFLGTAEMAPDVDLIGAFEPIMNDMAGSMLPMDRIYEGEEALISTVITFWDETSVEAVRAATAWAGGVSGIQFFHDVGSIMGQEGLASQFWMMFPFSAKPAMAGMQAGYHFHSCFRIGDHKHQFGTTVNKNHFMIKAQRKLVLPLGTSLNSRMFELYDHDMSAVSGVVIDAG